MGTPLPNNESSSGCALIFGDGGLIGGVQPRYVDVLIQDCQPQINGNFPDADLGNGTYRLQHTFGCDYALNTSEIAVRLQWGFIFTQGRFDSGSGLATTFIKLTSAGNLTNIPGTEDLDVNRVSVGGEMIITWPLDGL